ncbi:putative cullin [Helianthus annuus]|nr:putative cullin [Helianthus annuus]KAJ0557379.1 putative cullin [Helianthus annuus]KAJ0728897.1 putative cullin [Helianthus annuus]
MFTDMKTSEDTMKQFYETMGPELGDGPTLVVSVLTTGSWPIKSIATCNLPSEIQTVYDKFKNQDVLPWDLQRAQADLANKYGVR